MDDSFYGNRHREDFSTFSEDDEYDINDKHTSLPIRHSPMQKAKSRDSYGFKQRPMKSKYDNRPRNVVLTKDGFSPVHRHRHGDSPANRLSPEQSFDGVYLGQEEDLSEEGEEGGVVGGVRGRDEGLMWYLEALVSLEWWKLVLVAGVMGVVLAAIYQGDIGSKFILGFSSRDNLLGCASLESDRPCLSYREQQRALQLAEVALPYLHKTAGQYECGVKAVSSQSVSIASLKTTLLKFDNLAADATSLQHFIYLVLFNPHWSVEWQDKSGNKLTDWIRNPLDSDLLLSRAPSLTLKCHIRHTLNFLWSVLRWLLLVFVGVAILLGIVAYYVRKRREEKRLKFMMVDMILDILKKHAETVKRKPDLLPYLATIHVRDLLIRPSERGHKLAVWKKACDWIAEYESRVRVEQQQIAGQEFAVWRWIPQELAVTTAEPFNTRELSGKSSTSDKGRGGSSPRDKDWYEGTTFDDDSGRNTGRNNRINSSCDVSQCIRLKNMFEYVKKMSEEQVKEIQDSVLDRCAAHGGVVHIYVDTRHNQFGCVYLKMDSLKSAIGAYQALHGGWYKGKLVTAKYIPLAKYHKWFPDAMNAKVHLRPSS